MRIVCMWVLLLLSIGAQAQNVQLLKPIGNDSSRGSYGGFFTAKQLWLGPRYLVQQNCGVCASVYDSLYPMNGTLAYDAGTLWLRKDGNWVNVLSGGGGGGSVEAGAYIRKSGDTVGVDTASMFAKNFASPNHRQVPTTAAVNGLLAGYATVSKVYSVGDSVAGVALNALGDTSDNLRAVFSVALADSMDVVRDSLANLRALANAKLNKSDTGVIVATVKGVRDSASALRALANTKLNISDTSGLVATVSRVKHVGDSVAALIPVVTGYVTYSDTGVRVATVKGVRDSAAALRALGNTKLNISDTGVFVATVKGVRDSASALRALSNTKLNISDTGVFVATVKGVRDSASVLRTLANGAIRGLTGDVTATGSGTVTATLATVNATPGTYGSATAVPVVTVDNKGRVSSITTTNPSVTTTNTATLTNKRITPRWNSDSTSYTTSLTMNSDNWDGYLISAQAGALLFNAPSGTPTHGQLLVVDIDDNGTARALSYNSAFAGTGPTTTTVGKTTTIVFKWHSVRAKWLIQRVVSAP